MSGNFKLLTITEDLLSVYSDTPKEAFNMFNHKVAESRVNQPIQEGRISRDNKGI